MDLARLNSLCPRLSTYGGRYITVLMRLAYLSRGDLAQRFSLETKFDRTVYFLWFLTNAGNFFGLSKFWLIEPNWKLLHGTPSPSYGDQNEAPLSVLQLALWLAYPMAKQFDLQSPEERMRIEMLVASWKAKPHGLEFMPISAAARSFSKQKETAVTQDASQPITVFMHAVWRSRGDLQNAFPLDTKEQHEGFVHWFDEYAANELDLSPFASSLTAPRGVEQSDDVYRLLEVTGVEPQSFGLNVIGSVSGGSGIAKHGQSTVNAAHAARVPVCMMDHGIHQSDPVEGRVPPYLVSQDFRFFANVSCFNPDAFPNFISRFRLDEASSHHEIYYGNWEFPDYPKTYQEIARSFDEIWAPSQFALETWTKSIGIPASYMPLPVTVNAGKNLTREYFGLPSNKYLFLFCFDFWSWLERKNPEACVDSFLEAFPSGTENVGLVLKTKSCDANHDSMELTKWQGIKAKAARDQRIHIIEQRFDDDELHDLMRCCDAFVSLHRAEGFGLSIAEAMLLGKPTIATNYSGSLDFTTNETACLVDCELVPVPADVTRRMGIESVWAEPNVSHAASLMRKLHAEPAFAKRIASAGQDMIMQHFSPSAIGNRISRRLQDIWDMRNTKEDEAPLFEGQLICKH
jgi:glycosyltransferase involved in cell wall biosynthesis